MNETTGEPASETDRTQGQGAARPAGPGRPVRPRPDFGPWLPYLLLLVPPLCWAGNFIVGRAVRGEIPPVALTFWRWVIALLVLLPLALPDLLRRRAMVRQNWRLLTALAVTGVVLFQFLVYQGLRTTTAVNGVLIIAAIPAVIPVFAYVLDRRRPTARQAIGIAISFLGVAAVILQGDLSRLFRLDLVAGDAWVAGAVPMWALYSVLVRRRPADLPALPFLLAMVAIGVLLLLPAYGWELAAGHTFAFSAASAGAIVYVGLFASVVAFLCWNEGVGLIGPDRAGLFIHLMPVFATVLAITLLDERLHLGHAIGMALVGTGLYLSSTAGRR